MTGARRASVMRVPQGAPPAPPSPPRGTKRPSALEKHRPPSPTDIAPKIDNNIDNKIDNKIDNNIDNKIDNKIEHRSVSQSGAAVRPGVVPMPFKPATHADPTFEAARPRLFAIAYRMLGSISDAEDIVQDAWLRWTRARADADAEIREPTAYLARATTRLAIDRLRQVKRRRETYVGPWLPEPLIDRDLSAEREPPSASEALALAESLKIGFLVLLETLGPTDRAVFLLREAFDYDYAEIAAIVGKTPTNCRQIFARARKRLAADRPETAQRGRASRPARRDSPSPTALLEAFIGALTSRDLPKLEALLAEDAVFHTDHGGRVRANRRPIYGANAIARFLLGLLKKLERDDGALRTEFAVVNGQLGLINYVDGAPLSVIALDINGGVITAFHSINNPEKLQALAGSAEARSQS